MQGTYIKRSTIEDRVKKIIAEQLEVKEEAVSSPANLKGSINSGFHRSPPTQASFRTSVPTLWLVLNLFWHLKR